MERTAPWALVSASAAPVVLIGGWTIAAARQPPGFSSVRDTISALAAHGATDRWVMTAALYGLGACHVFTASGLRSARTPGRALLGVGGVATALVAAFPQPAVGGSTAHTVAATASFVALGAWPAFAGAGTSPALLLRTRNAVLGSAALLGLVTWFAVELNSDRKGLSERAAAGAEALWPLATAASVWLARRRTRGTVMR